VHRPIRALAVGALFAAGALGAQQPAPSTQVPQIVTFGEGEVRVTPDRATIYIGVQTRAATAAAAANENSRLQTAVIDTIRKLGVPPAQITTTGFSVNPEMRFDQTGQRPRVVAYVVSNVVQVELRQIDRVGPVIDAALARGANQINRLVFAASNAAQLRRAALDSAVANARADAAALAQAAGGRLGHLLEVTTGGPIRPMFDMRAAMAVEAAPAPTPIEPGQTTISASVTTRWLFLP
jgi:uncharacterized protein